MKLSELITRFREEHGISQRKMASMCNLSTGYISLIEKDRNPQTGKKMVPTITVLNKIARGMGMTLDDLLSMCDDMEVSLSERDDSAPPVSPPEQDERYTLREKQLISSYRAAPQPIKKAVDGLLEPYEKQNPTASSGEAM